MVVVLAIKGFDVQRDARGLREAMEPVREELGVHLAQSRLRETRFPDAVRPPRNIEDAAGQRLVHRRVRFAIRSDEHTSELQSLMRISYAVFCLKKKNYYDNEAIKQIGRANKQANTTHSHLEV